MPLPTLEAYCEAVQHPANLGLPILRSAELARDEATGQPLMWPGAFGVVFRLHTAGGAVRAIKCFTTKHKSRDLRYGAIADYVARLLNAGAASAPYLGECYYAVRGIQVNAEWSPVLVMGWLEGEPLNAHAARLCTSEAAGPRLRELARRWAALLLALREDQVVHGDLQHGNVLVQADGSFKLMDYDGMCVPALAKRYVMEGGHPNYQHPRRGVHFTPLLDTFSGLVILTALLSLSTAPDLWRKYDTGRNMLFQAGDFQEPADSRLFAELQGLEEPDAQAAVQALKRACLEGVQDQVQLFEQVLENASGGPALG